MFIRGSGFVKWAYLMQTHKQKNPAKDLKAIESKIFSNFKLKVTIYCGAILFTAFLTAYKVLLTREMSPRYDFTFLILFTPYDI